MLNETFFVIFKHCVCHNTYSNETYLIILKHAEMFSFVCEFFQKDICSSEVVIQFLNFSSKNFIEIMYLQDIHYLLE